MKIQVNRNKVVKELSNLQQILEDEVFENSEKFHQECILAIAHALPKSLTSEQKNKIIESIYAQDSLASFITFEIKVHIEKQGFKQMYEI